MSHPSSIRFYVGLILGLAGALLGGEFVSRFSPPPDLQPFLGETRESTGIFRADRDLGIAYRSVQDFRDDYAQRLDELEAPARPKRTWLWLGSSFVQAPGMLGDMAQADRPDIRMFYLKRNAELPVRVAQLRLLLDNGLKPERVVFVLVPMDVLPLVKHPLRMMAVNRRGAITYRWRLAPAPFERLFRFSRLSLLAWIRSGGDSVDPSYQPNQITENLPSSLRDDLSTIFRTLGDLSKQHNVPITVVLLPNREQIFGKSGYALQDFERERCKVEDLDWLDTRDLFVAEQDKLSLFLSDWHFNDKGNRLILDALYAHRQPHSD